MRSPTVLFDAAVFVNAPKDAVVCDLRGSQLRSIQFRHSIPPELKQRIIDRWRVIDPLYPVSLGPTSCLLSTYEYNRPPAMQMIEERHVNLLLHVTSINAVQVHSRLFRKAIRIEVKNGADANCCVMSFDVYFLYNPTVATAFSLNSEPDRMYLRTIFSER